MPAPAWMARVWPCITMVRMVMPEIHVSVKTEVAYGPAVGTPRPRFQFVNNLHGPDLGGAGQGPGREGGPEDVEAVLPFGHLGADMGDQVHHMGIAFHDHQFADLDRAGAGDPAQVVSSQIHQHDMFGPFLGVFEEFSGQPAGRPLRWPLFFGSRRWAAVPLVFPSWRTNTSGDEPIKISSSIFR